MSERAKGLTRTRSTANGPPGERSRPASRSGPSGPRGRARTPGARRARSALPPRPAPPGVASRSPSSLPRPLPATDDGRLQRIDVPHHPVDLLRLHAGLVEQHPPGDLARLESRQHRGGGHAQPGREQRREDRLRARAPGLPEGCQDGWIGRKVGGENVVDGDTGEFSDASPAGQGRLRDREGRREDASSARSPGCMGSAAAGCWGSKVRLVKQWQAVAGAARADACGSDPRRARGMARVARTRLPRVLSTPPLCSHSARHARRHARPERHARLRRGGNPAELHRRRQVPGAPQGHGEPPDHRPGEAARRPPAPALDPPGEPDRRRAGLPGALPAHRGRDLRRRGRGPAPGVGAARDAPGQRAVHAGAGAPPALPSRVPPHLPGGPGGPHPQERAGGPGGARSRGRPLPLAASALPPLHPPAGRHADAPLRQPGVSGAEGQARRRPTTSPATPPWSTPAAAARPASPGRSPPAPARRRSPSSRRWSATTTPRSTPRRWPASAWS